MNNPLIIVFTWNINIEGQDLEHVHRNQYAV